MEAPLLIFDHINKVVAAVPTGHNADKRLADLLASQRDQIWTNGLHRH